MQSPFRLGAVAFGCAAALTLPLAPAGAAPAGATGPGAHHSPRPPLTDQDFYFVMGDRFANGVPSNDEGGLTGDKSVTGFDPTDKGYYHGGDLEGLRSKLDYIKGLGTDAIWLTPIFKNKAVQPEDSSAGYHGYWITDFTQVDPHLGTNQDLTRLIRAAHRRGMKVFFDIITNHTADVIGYQEGARTAYVPKDQVPYRTAGGRPFDDRSYAGTGHFPQLDPDTSFPYHPLLDPGEESLKKPAWLNDVTLYHNRGNTTFSGEDSQYGDFYGLDDLFTENPRVVSGMTAIYRRWVRDFGIDGFRIDTMKHVNDEFWQQFAPGIVRYAQRHGRPDFFMFGEVALDGYDAAAKSLSSHYTTHDDVQSVLDFPFKDAARDFASRSLSARQMAGFYRLDDWYTDANSNAYQLPTFLGNHDNGRIGWFLTQDNPGAGDAELLARDRLAHELMYFSRGNPVVYYGDEQGFTGTGGDQLARQDMFPSQTPEYQDDTDIGSDATPADDNFDTGHPLYKAIARLSRLTHRHPALRDGAQQQRYAAKDAGILAFSRIDRARNREYVVLLNNSESPASASVPTYMRNGGFRRLFGTGPDTLTTGADRRLDVQVDGLSAQVYVADDRIPRSHHAPRTWLVRPHPAAAAHGRMELHAKVSGSSFYEVTFQAKVGSHGWRSVGTDDNAPYRVFHDTSDLPTGTPLRYRAVVLDDAGHTRLSNVRRTHVRPPAISLVRPSAGGTVSTVAPFSVTAAVDPERASERVRFERSVAGGEWESLGVDWSSPVYTVTEDVSDLPVGTEVRYRAELLEPGTPRIYSDPVSATVTDLPVVTLVGNLQSELGCPADWLPDCLATGLTYDTGDGLWHGTFTLPVGSYQWKIALNNTWDENYGADGGTDNIPLTVPAGGATYEFTWNPVTHVPSVAEAP